MSANFRKTRTFATRKSRTTAECSTVASSALITPMQNEENRVFDLNSVNFALSTLFYRVHYRIAFFYSHTVTQAANGH